MPYRDQADTLTCRNFRLGTCDRSDPVILEEDAMHVQMGCRTCRCGWVVTLPDGKARARYQSKMEAIKQEAERRRQREQRPVIFT